MVGRLGLPEHEIGAEADAVDREEGRFNRRDRLQPAGDETSSQ